MEKVKTEDKLTAIKIMINCLELPNQYNEIRPGQVKDKIRNIRRYLQEVANEL